MSTRVSVRGSNSEAKSVSERGVGLLPAPTKPVTPRVLRTMYQVSLVMSIFTST